MKKNVVRICGGEFSGRTLLSASNQNLRPTSHRVKKSMFDIIGNSIMNTCFLDLFAGTGAVGLEALSRGAAICVFVEKQPSIFKILLKNTDFIRQYKKIELKTGDALVWLPKLLHQFTFDYIYIDPPYGLDYNNKVIHCILNHLTFISETTLIFEYSVNADLKRLSLEFEILRMCRYGQTQLSFCRVLGV
ncbi:16S rRNA (guanine(966)-N(2))-methyltransferase RsmD [bacterium]|nr:16S rRNA (guanine(966)-N(2))-methyltransferase RsmD [candidate division CSSED10-310 bacterium]